MREISSGLFNIDSDIYVQYILKLTMSSGKYLLLLNINVLLQGSKKVVGSTLQTTMLASDEAVNGTEGENGVETEILEPPRKRGRT